MMVADHGGKLVKNLRGAAQKYVGVGFFLGVFLVLLTYFTLSEQFAIAAPNGASSELLEFSLLCSAFTMLFFFCLLYRGRQSIIRLKSSDQFSLVQPKEPLC